MNEPAKKTIGKVLVIEDDEDVISVVEEIFRDNDYLVKVARTGKEAFNYIFKAPPDLIILDINLPDLDGFHVVKEMKRNMMLRHIPIILLSGRPDFLDKLKSFDVVVDEYLIKPFNIQELLMRAKLVLERVRTSLDANPLTRLPGNLEIVKTIKSHLASGKPYAVGYADLNNFKAYNDKYGFSQGDRVISYAAKIITESVQNLSPKINFVGHVGGDDFIFVCEYEKGNDVCERITEEFDKGIAKFYSREDAEKGFIIVEDRRGIVSQFPLVGVAIGMVSDEGKKFQNIGQVNHSLTQLKKYAKSFQGSAYVRDRRTLAASLAEFTWGGASGPTSSKVLESITNALGEYMPGQIADIIDRQQISVLFQPLLDMKNDEVMGHEALVRGPQGTPLEYPDALFQTARNANRVVDLDILCMRQIGKSVLRFNHGLKLFINLYPETLLEEDRLKNEIMQNPTMKSLDIIFELAGSQRASDASDLFSTLHRLKKDGMKICVDGQLVLSGHGLRYLPELRPDYVKINMMQYKEMSKDYSKRDEFVKAVNLIKTSGSQVICTKLESRADAFLATEMGVTIGQGFLFARPEIPPMRAAG